MNNPKYSVVVPVYNRPGEVKDFLNSLLTQTRNDFEVILVEDGSTITCEDIAREYSSKLPIRYYFKSNNGPGPARNFGFAHAHGEYFVVFDSDCIIPPRYFEWVDQTLKTAQLDVWGGPDRAHDAFTALQRAMAYTMSSFLTTGGIRGGKKSMGWFQPRSFNMGISKKVFEATGGFRFDRFAEDIEFSIRIKKAGFRIGLIPEAFVFHKRRAGFGQFFKQVYYFGKGRALVGAAHPEEVKLTHWFPAIFTLGSLMLPVLYFIHDGIFAIALALFVFYLTLIFFHSLLENRALAVAGLSMASALIQLWGYGIGFIVERINQFKTRLRAKTNV